MSKISSNQNVKVVWILSASLTNPDHPSATELNTAGLDISSAIAFDSFSVGATSSDDVNDRALTDLGSAITRGFANYAATISLFADATQTDSSSIYNQAKAAFQTGLIDGYLVTRVGKAATTAFAAEDKVSVYKFKNGVPAIDGSGDTVKLVTDFLPQGVLYVNTLVNSTSPVVSLPATVTLAVAAKRAITASINGVDVTHSCTYSSSDSTKATVSSLGVITAVATGSATITCSHPSASASDSTIVTIS
jgi:uncharacterized protein YjdB